MLRRVKASPTSAAWLVLLAAASLSAPAVASDSSTLRSRQAHRFGGRPAGKPAYVWLWYANGGALPDFSEYCSDIRNPPAYQCNFASTSGESTSAPTVTDCQREVQRYLDEWYQDFNVLFTLTRPPSGDYYIVAITSGWPACAQEAADRTGGVAANEGGIAPFNLACVDNVNQTAIAIQCGINAHDCAAIIAHEHGHLVGLVHTASPTGSNPTDVMNRTISSEAAGFLDQSLSTIVDSSNSCSAATQNSYRQMLNVLGPWSGGSKPSLFASVADGGVPDAESGDTRQLDVPDAQATGSIIGPGQGRIIDGGVTVLAGFDAYTRTPPVIPDAPTADPIPSPKQGGCALSQTRPAAPLDWAAALMVGCALLGRAVAGSRRTRARRP